MKNQIHNKLYKLFTDRTARIEATQQNLLLFFTFYFNKYITYHIAPFQIEMLQILQDLNHKTIAITAFRGSGKSTLCSLVYVIWAIIGIHQKKNVIIVCQTEDKARQTLINIRRVLESFPVLLNDHGTFYSNSDEWNKRTLVISKYQARITVVSVSESVRGILHDNVRPDLIVYDDIEDRQSAMTQEGRDKVQDILGSEFMPLGTRNTRHVYIGNLVHLDSMMSRLKKRILAGSMSGVYKEYPLVTDEGTINWLGQFPDIEAIETLRKQQISDEYFQQEYQLKIIPVGKQLISPENIRRYYESDLRSRADFQMYLITIDPAVSGDHTLKRDKTGIITWRQYGSGEKVSYYMSPNPINDWLEWPEIIKKVKHIVSSFGSAPRYKILVEGGSTQKGLTQMLKYEGLDAEEVLPNGNDKRTRVAMTVPLLANKLLFPIEGIDELEQQMYYFGVERYDDLVDALTLLTLAMPEIEAHLSSGVVVSNNFLYEPIERIMNNMYSSGDEDEHRTVNDWRSWTRLMG